MTDIRQLNNEKMKWNWGTKIALVYIGFCAFIIFLVVKTFREDVALVSDDYYLQEIIYQDRIDEITNAASLDYQVEIRQGSEYIEAVFPDSGTITGQIHFYRPDNERLDRKFDFEGTALVSKGELAAGRYRMKISWTDSERNFYTEKIIMVTK